MVINTRHKNRVVADDESGEVAIDIVNGLQQREVLDGREVAVWNFEQPNIVAIWTIDGRGGGAFRTSCINE